MPRAQAGLRRELHRLRKLTSPYDVSLLHSDFRTIRLNLVAAEADVRHNIAANAAEFLEGLDLSGEDNFEDWLREMRCNLADCPKAVDKNRMLKDAEYEDNRLPMVMRELPTKRNFT
jgi:DNA-binding SARP family transcriptional activator